MWDTGMRGIDCRRLLFQKTAVSSPRVLMEIPGKLEGSVGSVGDVWRRCRGGISLHTLVGTSRSNRLISSRYVHGSSITSRI